MAAFFLSSKVQMHKKMKGPGLVIIIVIVIGGNILHIWCHRNHNHIILERCNHNHA